MKKVFMFGVMLFLLSGCTSGEEFSCTVNGKDATITLKDGIITSYTLDGTKKSQSEIDEINGEYFTSATNNAEGKDALNRYMLSVAGSCN